MGHYPESELIISLNTFTCYLEPTPGERLKTAHNDPVWSSVSDSFKHTTPDYSHPLRQDRNTQLTAANDILPRARDYQVDRPHPLIKYVITASSIERHLKRLCATQPSRHVTVLEVDCRFQTFKRFLSGVLRRGVFLGIDKEPRCYPDLVANIQHPYDRKRVRALNSDVIVSFDAFLSHRLTIVQARAMLANLADLASDNTRVFFAVPQRLKKKKIYKLSQSHSQHFDAHELTVKEWEALIGEFFTVCEIRSLGVLARLKTSSQKRLQTRNQPGSVTVDSVTRKLLTLVDLGLTKFFGKNYLYKRCSHSLLFATELKRP